MTPDLPPVMPGNNPPPVPEGFLKDMPDSVGKWLLWCMETDYTPEETNVYPLRGTLFVDFEAGGFPVKSVHDGLTEVYWKKITEAPIARANGIGGEEIPAGLPPLPPVPKGYDRWEYRGKSIKDINGPYLYAYPDGEEWITPEGWPGQEYGSVHYIEAVKQPTSDPCESEAPKPDEREDDEATLGKWLPIRNAPEEQVLIVTDWVKIAFAEKSPRDSGGFYWADGDDSGLDWEPTHFQCRDAKPTPPKPVGETPRADSESFTMKNVPVRIGINGVAFTSAEVTPAWLSRKLETELYQATAALGTLESDLAAARATITSLRAALEAEEEARIYEESLKDDPSNPFLIGPAEVKRRIANELRLAALAPASSGKGEANG